MSWRCIDSHPALVVDLKPDIVDIFEKVDSASKFLFWASDTDLFVKVDLVSSAPWIDLGLYIKGSFLWTCSSFDVDSSCLSYKIASFFSRRYNSYCILASSCFRDWSVTLSFFKNFSISYLNHLISSQSSSTIGSSRGSSTLMKSQDDTCLYVGNSGACSRCGIYFEIILRVNRSKRDSLPLLKWVELWVWYKVDWVRFRSFREWRYLITAVMEK